MATKALMEAVLLPVVFDLDETLLVAYSASQLATQVQNAGQRRYEAFNTWDSLLPGSSERCEAKLLPPNFLPSLSNEEAC